MIDIFSRFAFVHVIKTKTANEVARKLKLVLDDPRMKTVQSFRTDLGYIVNVFAKIYYSKQISGTEFVNATVGKLCEERGIQQYFANPVNKTKCEIVERFNRTFKDRLGRMQHHANLTEKGRVRKRWIDLVETVVAQYNTG